MNHVVTFSSFHRRFWHEDQAGSPIEDMVVTAIVGLAVFGTILYFQNEISALIDTGNLRHRK